MGSHVRITLLALLAGSILALGAPAAQAEFGIAKFQSLACTENAPEGKPGECNAETPGQFFKQAGGHPNFGITDFTFNGFGLEGNGVKTIRTDLPVGFSTNPQAFPQCTLGDFEANLGTAEENHCNANTEAGTQEITVVVAIVKGVPVEATLTGKVFNLVTREGLPLEFGIDVNVGTHVHSLLEGGVSWHKEAEASEEGIESGDYHEYFKIKFAKALSEGEAPLVRSRLAFNGKLGNGLLTNPTACPGPQTTHLRVEPFVGKPAFSSYKTTVTAEEENCAALKFEPAFTLTPSTTQLDMPAGITTDLAFPLNTKSSETENSDLETTKVTLPPGMTINAAAAAGLEVCTPEQFSVGEASTEPVVACPARSAIGSAVLNVPGLPPESLTGKVYLGESVAGPITGPPYLIDIVVASKRYGQLVRQQASVMPDPLTGQLTATVERAPQGPFRDLRLSFDGGQLADLATPLSCGGAKTRSEFSPYSGVAPLAEFSPQFTEFIVDGNGAGGACASPTPFNWTQATSAEPAQAGASSTVSLTLERGDGEQYVGGLRNVLAPGLVGIIPSVTLCGEPEANSGKCTSASQIGTANVAAGAGKHPYHFAGRVYLTGPYEGAPYGLSIVVPAVAEPSFNLGNVVARAKIEVDPHTAQVIASDASVPRIVGGIPIRQKSITLTINRPGFVRNPTSCGPVFTETTLTSTLGATDTIPPTPFAIEGCSSLGFSPSFSASTSAKTSKAGGASLEVHVTQASGQANIRSVVTQLPTALPSRLTTLQKSCGEATFAANPLSCRPESFVGTATVVTPALPGQMTGPAILVSHGGEAFPDLDLVLEDQGVRVILVGNTHIKSGITTTTFKSTPDVPASSFRLKLPTGPHSALATDKDLCAISLVMPTTITAQNGKTIKQNTIIKVTECGVKIVGHRVIGNVAYLTVRTFAAGRIRGSGANVAAVARRFTGPRKAVTLKVPLTRRGRSRHHPLRVRLRVGFVPAKKGPHSSASVTVTFR